MSTSQHLQSGEIRAEVSIDPEVAQNRTATFTLRISWAGDLDRYEIVNLETPGLSNLEIDRTASSNWVGEIDGVKHAIKTYEYELRPQSMGMGYVDGMIIDYLDHEYDEQQSLVTNRLQIKVVDPIIEADYSMWYLGAGMLLALAVVVVTIRRVMHHKKAREEERRAREMANRPIEEHYLPELKNSVDLDAEKPVESFSALSKLFRRYLSEKYEIAGLEGTTAEICQQLNQRAVEGRTIEHVKEVLDSCDLAKFSGGDVQKDVLQRSYTLVEDMLIRNREHTITTLS